MKKLTIRRDRRAPRNLVRDMRTLQDELLDEMATKWAVQAEKLSTTLAMQRRRATQ